MATPASSPPAIDTCRRMGLDAILRSTQDFGDRQLTTAFRAALHDRIVVPLGGDRRQPKRDVCVRDTAPLFPSNG